MSNYHPEVEVLSINRGITLNDLKDELHSLNMRLLFATQHHNGEAQEDIKKQMAEVQAEIDRMCLRGTYHL